MAGLLVLLVGLDLARPGHVPQAQAQLVVVDRQALSTLRDDFNRMSGSTRIILLLSPT
jgi:hypothetical protein